MEIFDVKRRDIFTFDDYMDLKKPGFGGPSSAEPLKDNKGKFVNKDRKLENFQNKVKRHPSFSHQVWDSTYKAMGGDLVHKQEDGKNPYEYPDSYDTMGIPVVDVTDKLKKAEAEKDKVMNEGVCYADFDSFVFESCESCDEDSECEECSEEAEGCKCEGECTCED